jgi:hypothetical protein
MGQLNYENGLLIMAGLLLHFLSCWGEEWRKDANHVGPLEYARQDAPGWTFAMIAAAISYAVLPQLGPVLGIEPPLGALLAGYTASSLGSKLTALKK